MSLPARLGSRGMRDEFFAAHAIQDAIHCAER